jgi:hypothetical protein
MTKIWPFGPDSSGWGAFGCREAWGMSWPGEFLTRDRVSWCCSAVPPIASSPISRHPFWIERIQDLRFSRWWLWRMMSSGMFRRVALVRTDVSEELSASFIRVTRIGELGTTLAVTSNRRTLRRNTNAACVGC